MDDKEFILEYLGKIVTDIEEIVNYILPEDSAVYVDERQNLNLISMDDAMKVINSFGDNSVSEMIGKADYILIYNADRKLVIDGDAYLPSGYIVMKASDRLCGLNENDINTVMPELISRMSELMIGQHHIQAYKLG